MTDVCVNPIDGAEMVWIPPGEFLRGSDMGGNESPKRLIYLDGYWIYKYQVTFAQYAAFCNAIGAGFPEKPVWGWHSDHPVVNVTWFDACAYCEWAGTSLPTESQWEKAAYSIDGRWYPWGGDWDASICCNSANGNILGTSSVKDFPMGASPFGVLQMAGNVWEWCEDWFDVIYYNLSPNTNLSGPVAGAGHVVRGGAWNNVSPVDFSRTARVGYDNGFHDLGFRCVIRPTLTEATP